jgi:predicted transcriptional regulator
MSLPENRVGRNIMDTLKLAQHLTAKIVGSYVRHHTTAAGQLSDLITTVQRALVGLGQPNLQKSFELPLCPCDVPYSRTMWFAWIVATGENRYAGILTDSTA